MSRWCYTKSQGITIRSQHESIQEVRVKPWCKVHSVTLNFGGSLHVIWGEGLTDGSFLTLTHKDNAISRGCFMAAALLIY